jgi:hypothetical protein
VRKLLALTCAALVAGCGGGSGGSDDADTAAAPPGTTPTGVQTVTVPDTARLQETPDGDPQFTIQLETDDTTVQAGRPWEYTVRAADSDGQPASATAKMRVFADGELVDTLGWFPFDGELTRTHTWSRTLVDKEVYFQAEVEGSGGTQRRNVEITVGQ